MDTSPALVYQIALTLIPGIGDVLGKKLVTVCGSAEAVFKEPRKVLKRVPGIGEVLAGSIGRKEIFLRAEKEIGFLSRFRIRPMFFQDPEYPARLKHCTDGPVMLYFKGNRDVNQSKMIGIVGTRSASAYGKNICRTLVEGLLPHQVIIVSGLAYGIDSCAHRVALDKGLTTIGVLGHGLDRIYPYSNKGLAEKMIHQGGLITEFLSGTNPDRENFPRRNRIIAGLCDAIVVVEAATKGGALITANIANSYHRDVFAVPGRLGDTYSEGANFLIRTNQAALIQSVEDIEYIMGWKTVTATGPRIQKQIFFEMTPDEEMIVQCLSETQRMGIDEIMLKTSLPMSKISAALLNLEFEGVVACQPGKVYVLL